MTLVYFHHFELPPPPNQHPNSTSPKKILFLKLVENDSGKILPCWVMDHMLFRHSLLVEFLDFWISGNLELFRFLVMWAWLQSSVSIHLSVCLYTPQFPWCSDPWSLHHGKVQLAWERNLCDPPICTMSWKVVKVTVMEKLGCPERETCVPPSPFVMEKCEGHNVTEILSCPNFWKLASILSQFLGWGPCVNQPDKFNFCLVGHMVWLSSWIWQKTCFGHPGLISLWKLTISEYVREVQQCCIFSQATLLTLLTCSKCPQKCSHL